MNQRRTTSHRAIMAIVAVLIGLAAMLSAPSPANAAASCYRSTCNGQDPQVKGCAAGAYNVASFNYQGSSPWLQGVLLELRYSPACDAAWVRTTGGDCFDSWRPCISVLQVQGGSEQWGGPAPGQRWTNMWSFRHNVRGCFKNGDDYHLDGCTAWR